jgi:hypothetical protein
LGGCVAAAVLGIVAFLLVAALTFAFVLWALGRLVGGTP